MCNDGRPEDSDSPDGESREISIWDAFGFPAQDKKGAQVQQDQQDRPRKKSVYQDGHGVRRRRRWRGRIKLRIDHYIREKGISAREAARQMGFSPQGLENLKHGRTERGDWATLAELADFFGVEIGDLFVFERRQQVRQRVVSARVAGNSEPDAHEDVLVKFALDDRLLVTYRIPVEDLQRLYERVAPKGGQRK